MICPDADCYSLPRHWASGAAIQGVAGMGRGRYTRVLQDVVIETPAMPVANAPMMQAENAIMIDTSSMTPEKAFSVALGVIEGASESR